MTRAADKLLRLYRRYNGRGNARLMMVHPTASKSRVFLTLRRIRRSVRRVGRILRDAIKRNDGNVTLLDDVTREPF